MPVVSIDLEFQPSGADGTIKAMAAPTNKPVLDPAGMESRMDEIRLKQLLGGPLTDQELMCLQFEQNGFGCGTCSSPTYVVGRRVEPTRPAEA